MGPFWKRRLLNFGVSGNCGFKVVLLKAVLDKAIFKIFRVCNGGFKVVGLESSRLQKGVFGNAVF